MTTINANICDLTYISNLLKYPMNLIIAIKIKSQYKLLAIYPFFKEIIT